MQRLHSFEPAAQQELAHGSNTVAAQAVSASVVQTRRLYVPLRAKFVMVLSGAAAWTVASVYLSIPWLEGLSAVVGLWLALFVITFIAYVPGFMNAFLIGSIVADRRPSRRTVDEFP